MKLWKKIVWLSLTFWILYMRKLVFFQSSQCSAFLFLIKILICMKKADVYPLQIIWKYANSSHHLLIKKIWQFDFMKWVETFFQTHDLIFSTRCDRFRKRLVKMFEFWKSWEMRFSTRWIKIKFFFWWITRFNNFKKIDWLLSTF